MITTGIIREINISSENITNNLYRVELPIFNTPSNTNGDGCIMECTACLPGGIYSSYTVGDLVYIGFINNEFQYPVILGKIYKGLTDEVRSFANLDSLKVTNNVELPDTIKIGSISYDTLSNSITDIQALKSNKQDVLNDTTTVGEGKGNIKTINNQSILGSGNIVIQGGSGNVDDVQIDGTSIVVNKIANFIGTQTTGQNIKTINGNSILGSGNLVIGGGITVDDELSTDSINPVQNKVITAKLNELEARLNLIESTITIIDENKNSNENSSSLFMFIDED